MAGTLYLVNTPIGNLNDITFRALQTLKTVDLIAAEDTRHTLKLLTHFEIKKPLTSYFEHNKNEKGAYLIGELKDGKNIALVTDAGAPAISDPGEDLVKLCIQNDINVTYIPGAVAFVSGLVLSGLSTSRFTFEGFLTVNKRGRKEHLEQVKHDPRTLIFYEAPHKLLRTLSDFYAVFGDRQIALARELTKKYEEVIRGSISEVLSHFSETNQPKGEFVVIVEGATKEDSPKEFETLSITEHIKRYTDEGLSKKDAQKAVAKDRGLSKSEVYKLELNEKK